MSEHPELAEDPTKQEKNCPISATVLSFPTQSLSTLPHSPPSQTTAIYFSFYTSATSLVGGGLEMPKAAKGTASLFCNRWFDISLEKQVSGTLPGGSKQAKVTLLLCSVLPYNRYAQVHIKNAASIRAN